jgi:predicted membrane protein
MARLRPLTFRHWVIAAFGAVAIGLLPWTLWLSVSLPRTHVSDHWDFAWTGFDIGVSILFGATAYAAYRRSTWVTALASCLGTLLVVDAWFDIVLESHSDERLLAVTLALVAELPAAVVCFWIARRTERFLSRVVEAAPVSELATPGERAAEGDLVGVLEIAPDGETAR